MRAPPPECPPRPRHNGLRAPRARRGLSAGTYLVLFALVPILAATVLTTTAIRDLRASQARAEDLQRKVEQYVEISRFRSALSNEHYYAGATEKIEQLNFSVAMIRDLTQIDVGAALEQARAEVDAQLGSLDWLDLRSEVDAARSVRSDDLKVALMGYTELERTLGEQARASFEDLHRIVSRMADADELDVTLDLLESTTVARQAVAAQLTQYFSIRFTGQRSGDGLIGLIEARATYLEAVADLERESVDRAVVDAALDSVVNAPEHARFLDGINGIIEAGVEPAKAAAPGDDIPQQLRDAADDYRAGTAVARDHLALIEVAAADVERAIAQMQEAQAERTTATMLTIALAGIASIVFVVALRRTFGRPLRSLAADARAIGQGRFAPAGRVTGPAEVREASLALHDASAHLQLVEHQALALARGDLADPVLHRPAAGSIGASLQEAVRTLAESMTEREEFRRRLVHEASHDGLTQLLNRNSTLARLTDRLATGTKVALLFIDLDGFKEINDEHGHQAGDQLLRSIAQRLVTRAREGDHVGRLGGDEFVVITDAADDEADVLTLARRLLDAIGAPIRTGDQELRVSASIGVAVSSSTEATADELLRDADLAVYHAKDSGRSCISVCTEELRASIAEQAHHEHAIRRAIANDELVMHYQPIVLADDHTLHGFESLVRWDRPGHGLLSPDRFVPFAERSDLVVDLDRWVLRRVARQLAEWSDHPELAGLSVAVNVSGRSLGSPTFVDDVLHTLGDAGVAPSRLVVEVTESALPDDLDGAADRLRALRASGVRTALDDFGTGYTSLAHLKTLPVDQIKIDRSFTKDESSESLVKLIIDTGHLLGATILAEGVETEAQAERLARLGSDALQGYLFGRPCDAGALAGQRAG